MATLADLQTRLSAYRKAEDAILVGGQAAEFTAGTLSGRKLTRANLARGRAVTPSSSLTWLILPPRPSGMRLSQALITPRTADLHSSSHNPTATPRVCPRPGSAGVGLRHSVHLWGIPHPSPVSPDVIPSRSPRLPRVEPCAKARLDVSQTSSYRHLAMDKTLQDFVNVMKALSDPNRVGIVMLLQQREMCACEIIPRLGLAQPTVSRHLKILMDAGLILGRKEGVWVHYRLPDMADKPYVATLLERLPGWIGQCPEVRELVRDIPKDNPCRGGDAATGSRPRQEKMEPPR